MVQILPDTPTPIRYNEGELFKPKINIQDNHFYLEMECHEDS